ncbi:MULTISPECIES: recombinase family protein [Clostridium]|uniref:recombinase family protein n=3 Tax=Clostridiaceae TaxID=31979 RepID=UPI00189F3528|nr:MULTISPECIES: recombinase family protein [Clostridium]MDU1937044.1 recombinase family protein [Clostridium sp.]MDU1979465.1 recombinase family protein [Clostridium sp.]MDU1995095.1 recombinase family protein [Clostridium sp.]MDU2045602.1 recombinase family protein [Clostridium sp.]MDU6049434.1 recombinase family protein [Clostridium sp.]
MDFKTLAHNVMMEKRKKRIAIYCRVSTIEQAEEGYSIDEQKRLLIEWCRKMDYIVTKCYSDRGISGKAINNRPALKELLKDAENKEFDMVLVWKINRISRKLTHVLEIAETLEMNNIAFKSYSEEFDNSTPSGKMQFQMMALVGEFERGTIAQNVKMGMCAKAKAGEWCGGQVLGYDLVPVEKQQGAKRTKTVLTINEKEAEAVRLIFNEYANGKGYKAITNQLNKLGYKTKKGNNFSVGSIRDILTNPVYIGKVRYNVRQNWSEKRRRNINANPIITDGIHKAIIDEKLWDKVQAILESKKGKPSRIYDGEYPLTGILRCPKCGAGMVIARTTNKLADGTKKRIAYYCCGNWKNKGTSVCNSNTIRVDKANEYVFSKLSELLSNEKMVKSIVKNVNKERHSKISPAKKELQRIDKELEKIDRKKHKLFEGYEEDLISKEEFKERKEELNKIAQMLQEQKEPLLVTLSDDVSEEIPYEFIKSILENFSKVLTDSTSREQQKKLLHMIISEITINEAREVDSIKLKINDSLVEYISKEEGVSIEGTPSSFMLRNVGVNTLNLDIAI